MISKSNEINVSTPIWYTGVSITIPAGTYLVNVSAYSTGGSIRAGLGTNSGQWCSSCGAYAAAQFSQYREFTEITTLTAYLYPEYIADDIIYHSIVAIRIK